jgi:hypothetical protein
MTATKRTETFTKIERDQQWYEYRGVRFYTIEVPQTPAHEWSWSQKTKSQWGYICIPPFLSGWNEDTSIKEINDTLQGIDDGRFEHIRKEVSHFRDAPYTDDWQKPSWYVLAGWDYQHSWDERDQEVISIVYDCMKQIDLLFENNILTSPQ